MIKKICFDMDGTIADLYGVKDWLNRLESKDFEVYADAAPMCDMPTTTALLNDLAKRGTEINVISWASKTATPAEVEAIAEVKKAWLKAHNFECDNVYVVPYGTDKTAYVKDTLAYGEKALLFDDDERVRAKWNIGQALDPTKIKIENILKIILDKSLKV